MGMRSWFAFAAVLVACGGGESGSGGSGSVTTAFSGTWDVNTLGDDPAKAGSQLVIANDTVTGTLIDEDEGKDIGDGCIHETNRTALDFKFQGNAMTGTITVFNTWTNTGKGSSDPYFYCPTGDSQKPYTITGVRSNAGAGLDGDWEMSYSNKDPFVVTIAGNTAKAWDKSDKQKGKNPRLTAVVVGNSATSSGEKDRYGFGASRR